MNEKRTKQPKMGTRISTCKTPTKQYLGISLFTKCLAKQEGLTAILKGVQGKALVDLKKEFQS